MVVLGVVPGEEAWPWARASWIEPKRSGNSGRYFSVLNCASENGLSFGDVRPRVGLGHAEIGEQERDGLRGHRRAAVGVDVSCSRADALAGARLVDELLGQRGALAMGDHPADDVAAEDVEDDVQVEVGPLRRARAAW